MEATVCGLLTAYLHTLQYIEPINRMESAFFADKIHPKTLDTDSQAACLAVYRGAKVGWALKLSIHSLQYSRLFPISILRQKQFAHTKHIFVIIDMCVSAVDVSKYVGRSLNLKNKTNYFSISFFFPNLVCTASNLIAQRSCSPIHQRLCFFIDHGGPEKLRRRNINEKKE